MWGNVIGFSVLLSLSLLTDSLLCYALLLSLVCSHALLLALLLLRVNGKRSCLCWVSWLNKKEEEALYVFGPICLGYFLGSLALFLGFLLA